MKRFATTVLFSFVMMAAGLILQQAHAAVYRGALGLTSPHRVPVLTQQPGSFAAEEGHGITIATRKYKPRSTPPLRMEEEPENGTITIVHPHSAEGEGKRLGRSIALSRTIRTPLDAMTLRTAVERTGLAAGRHAMLHRTA